MSFGAPKTLGWWIEAQHKCGDKYTKEYSQEKCKTKEDAEKVFLNEFQLDKKNLCKLEVYEAIV